MDARGFERGTFTNANRTSMAGGVAFYQDWDLEGSGNWSREDDNGRVETQNHTDFNEINQRTVATQNATPTHDKNGNMTDTGFSVVGGQNFPGGKRRLEYDAFNRVRKVYDNANTTTTSDDVLLAVYSYDASNRRMRKVVTNSGALNGTTDFYYLGWRVMEEHDVNDAILQQYVYGNYLDEVWTRDDRRGGITVAQLNDVTGAQRLFYLYNTQFSVHGLVDEVKNLVEAYQFDAYGKQTVIADGNDGDTIVNFNANDVRTAGGNSGFNNPFMFTGQRFDPETGLLYYKNRYYSFDMGRFLSRDPLGGLWLYEYCIGSPTGTRDPLGLDAVTDAMISGLDIEHDLGRVIDSRTVQIVKIIAAVLGEEKCQGDARATAVLDGGFMAIIQHFHAGVGFNLMPAKAKPVEVYSFWDVRSGNVGVKIIGATFAWYAVIAGGTVAAPYVASAGTTVIAEVSGGTAAGKAIESVAVGAFWWTVSQLTDARPMDLFDLLMMILFHRAALGPGNDFKPAPAPRAGPKPSPAPAPARGSVYNEMGPEGGVGAARNPWYVPDYARNRLTEIRQSGVNTTHVGGGIFGNFQGKLPTVDAQGRPINYLEWDVHPYTSGVNRGQERIITGSDGRAWYTDNHYRSFTEIKP